MTEGTKATLPTETSDFRIGQNMPRYEMKYDTSLHRDIMVEAGEGDWVKLEDVRIWVMAYISGYLLEHRQMLQDQRAHPKIVEAVKHLEKQVNEL